MFTRMPQAPRRRHWQPRLPAAVKAEGEPLAAHIGAQPEIESVADLSYISVDEVSEGVVTLLVSDWPELDGRGRLRFPESEPAAVDVSQAAHEAFLAANRRPHDLAARPLREGDALAARTRIGRRSSARGRSSVSWIVPPVFDVTADARDAAKVAFFSAVGTPLSPDQIASIDAGGRDGRV
jgi:hypothetical protein